MRGALTVNRRINNRSRIVLFQVIQMQTTARTRIRAVVGGQ
jgi:hypothetical protein